MPIFSTLATMAGTIGTAALMGAGATAAGLAMSNAAKQQTQQANAANDITVTQAREAEETKKSIAEEKAAIEARTKAAAEAPDKAAAVAKSEVEKRKRIIALRGGKTLLSSEPYLGGTGEAKTLLGS